MKKFTFTMRICAGLAAICLLANQPCAMADPEEQDVPDTKIIEGTRHIVNFYNPFGVCYRSTQTATTTTQTTKGDQTSTTISKSVTESVWMDGSLKVQTVTGTNTTTNSAGKIIGTSESTTTYIYDSLGRLTGASGITTSTGELPDDGGTYASTTHDTYIIKNGQALLDQSVTTQTTKVDGQVKSTSTTTTSFDYELIGGTWHVMKETTVSHTDDTDGGSADITTIKTYSRDENGVCTGIEQTQTGTQVAIGENKSHYTSHITSYEATFEYDYEQGWHITKEVIDWSQFVPSGGQSASSSTSSIASSAAAQTAASNSSGSADSDGTNMNTIMPVYNQDTQDKIDAAIAAAQKRADENKAKIQAQIETYKNAAAARKLEVENTFKQYQTVHGATPGAM